MRIIFAAVALAAVTAAADAKTWSEPTTPIGQGWKCFTVHTTLKLRCDPPVIVRFLASRRNRMIAG